MTNMLNNANFEDYLKLSEKQQEYIRLKNETKKTDKQIAKEISIDTTTISRWKRKEDFRVGLRGYQAEYLANTVPKAIQTMIDLLGAKSELVRFQASKDILDRTGYNPVERQQIETTATVQFNDDIT
ncbi:DNA-binding protein [Staphylococcus pasteuri]|uniref:DNA-binding protein n=1 Tax=Staphylococcus pasteuri TaxID=45972 RepID=UPI001AD854E5|nr:DNA-binding protein [Staphylococcus pasteuri]MBM6506817.1 DNA-binding protein [Staphylococcus pasteuri]QQT21417.1 DNA-binding protein [Staphylococcus pasteuri]